MRKKELLHLPIATPALVPIERICKYLLCFRIHNLHGKQCAVIDAFDTPGIRLIHRIFLFENGYTSVTLRKDQVNVQIWRKGRIESILMDKWNDPFPVWDGESSLKLCSFLCESIDTSDCEVVFNAIMQWQTHFLDEKRLLSDGRKKAAIDSIMAAVKPLPIDFKEWLDSYVFINERYIIYNYAAKKKVDAYCTHCGSNFKMERVRHNATVCCPVCGTKATAWSSGVISQYDITKEYRAVVVQKYNDTSAIVRTFNARKIFVASIDHKEIRKERIEYSEIVRELYAIDNTEEAFEYSPWKTRYELRWCRYSKCYLERAQVYAKDLADEIKGTILQYSGIDIMAQVSNAFPFRCDLFIQAYKRCPSLEYIVKAKLFKIVADLTSGYTLNKITSRIAQAIRLHKDAIIANDAGLSEVKAYALLDEIGLKASYESIKELSKMHYVSKEKVLYLSRFSSIDRWVKYLSTQSSGSIDELNDYWKTGSILGYDFNDRKVLFPADLMTAHDDAISIDRHIKEEAINKKIHSIASALSPNYSYKSKDLMIVMPEFYRDFAFESMALGHCVRTYADSVASEECIILFIRKTNAPFEPYFTMEVRDNKIVQCRGKGNCDMSEDVKRFVRLYEENVLEKIDVRRAG